jgi:flagellar basal body P-ring protein FlgI
MKINWIYKDEIDKFLTFNDETGKYEKEIENYKITINSWNNKIIIEEKNGNVIKQVPIELIKTILDINNNMRVEFEGEE